MLRLLSWQWSDGPTNMALDEALLETAEIPCLRVYGWQPRCLSLGYFQRHADIAAALPEAIAMVRRITGGGAIWHEHEVTYAVVGRLGSDGFPARTSELYPLLHSHIARAIADAGGADLTSQACTVGDRRYRQEPRCFASPAGGDLMAGDGGKVLGSAARNRGDRLLVHGSLKLASNPWDGAVSSGCGLARDQAISALCQGVASALGHELAPSNWTEQEIAVTDRIRQARYGDDGWVVHRRGPRA